MPGDPRLEFQRVSSCPFRNLEVSSKCSYTNRQLAQARLAAIDHLLW